MFARDGLLYEPNKELAERILDVELDRHLASERAEAEVRSRATTTTAIAARRF